ncbi:hypothetical protein RCG23_14420 [Neobacillus sp. PS3-34]|nr:hypothetical protein [Neobacillus sp. PS3-34]WML46831.1 hypothetical protein RCG23_14420 [Neobacillus sp. PS3-34]
MSNKYWLTPEEYFKKKKRNKYLLYISLFIITAILSAVMTFLVNEV